jgi:hypothetical protein
LASAAETSCSSAGGLIGVTREIGSGCEPMMEVISDAWLFPSNARRPVAIS